MWFISEGFASAAGPHSGCHRNYDVQIRVWDSIFKTFVDHFGTLDHYLIHPGSPRGGYEVTWGRRYLTDFGVANFDTCSQVLFSLRSKTVSRTLHLFFGGFGMPWKWQKQCFMYIKLTFSQIPFIDSGITFWGHFA